MDWTGLLEREIRYTYDAADTLMGLVDESMLDWKPPVPEGAETTGWMTVGELLQHMTGACGMLCKAFAENDWSFMQPVPAEGSAQPPMPSVGTVAEARKALAADRALALETIRKAGDDRMANERVKAPWEVEGTLGEQFLDMVKHLGQHKGQLFYYLKLLGKPVHTGHLWGME